MAEFDALRVDELLYMQLARFLADISGGEEVVAAYDAVHKFRMSDDFARFFETSVGRPPEGPDRELAMSFFDAVYAPHHHNLYWEGYHDEVADADQAGADAVRTAMFTFMTAWSHRFGGIEGDIVKRGVLVDPSLRNPPK